MNPVDIALLTFIKTDLIVVDELNIVDVAEGTFDAFLVNGEGEIASVVTEEVIADLSDVKKMLDEVFVVEVSLYDFVVIRK